MAQRRTTISSDTKVRFKRVCKEIENFYEKNGDEASIKNHQFVIEIAEYVQKNATAKEKVLSTPFNI